MHWLQSQPAWGQSKEVEITTRQTGRQAMTNSSVGDLADEEEEETTATTADDLVHGRKKKKVTFVPSLGELTDKPAAPERKLNSFTRHDPLYILPWSLVAHYSQQTPFRIWSLQ